MSRATSTSAPVTTVLADRHECQDCGKIVATHALDPIRHLHERVSEGEDMPSGQCPACGALCHPVAVTFSQRVKVGATAVQEWARIQDEPAIVALTSGELKRLLHVALRRADAFAATPT